MRALFKLGAPCFRYYEGALVANAGHVPPQGTVESDGNSNRQLRKYVPSAKTGSRLPHMQLHALKSSNEVCPIPFV